MLQGLTAHYLTHSTYAIKPGDTALVHAAAGGAGQLITQVARLRGATVYGTVGSAAKAELARAGRRRRDDRLPQQDFEAEIKKLTNGRGVDVVYDSVGKDTFDKSLNCLRPRGYARAVRLLERPGAAVRSGRARREGLAVPDAPRLESVHRDARELVERAGDLFAWLASGELNPRIDRVLPLAEAARRIESSRPPHGGEAAADASSVVKPATLTPFCSKTSNNLGISGGPGGHLFAHVRKHLSRKPAWLLISSIRPPPAPKR